MPRDSRPFGRLLGLPKIAPEPGLARMGVLIEPLTHTPWWRRLDAIKVTGSNGKGSVARILASILHQLEVSHGLYTSPHWRDPRERIQVDDAWISPGELERAVDWFETRRKAWLDHHPGQEPLIFEALTTVALRHFQQTQPETVIAEVGIGGRDDPVRLVPGGLSMLVSVDREHTQLLGDTLEDILRTKADVAAPGSTLLCGPLPGSTLRRSLATHCQDRGIELVLTDELDVPEGLRDIPCALQGEHQVRNARLATQAAWLWLQRHRPNLDSHHLEAAVQRGLAEVRFPGRLEKIRDEPPVWVDVAHTPRAVEALTEALGSVEGRPILLVVGLSEGRAMEPLLAPLLSIADRVLVTRAHHRGADPARVARAAEQLAPSHAIRIAESIDDAMPQALASAAEHGLAVLVAGGLFLGAEAVAILEGRDPQDLEFF